MRTVFFITALLLIISCGEKMQPNQDLNLAFEYIKKGDFVTARTLADNAPQKNAADSAIYCMVRWAEAAISGEWYDDSTGIKKCITFFDGDDEKSAWAHLLKGTCFYNFNRWDSAVVETLAAEKLAYNIDCNELKFLIYNQLATLNVDSQNYDLFDEVIGKIKKYAVSGYDKSEYYSWKSYSYKLGKIGLDSAKYYAKMAVDFAEDSSVKKTWNMMFYYYNYAELIRETDTYAAEKYLNKSLEIDTLNRALSLLGEIFLNRGDIDKANFYFEKASEKRFDFDVEGKQNRWLHEFYAREKNFEKAYGFALKQISVKDSVIQYLENSNIKPVQVKFEGEIKQLKIKSALEKKILLILLISAVVLSVLVLTVVFMKLKLVERKRKIFEAQQTINGYNQKIKELQNMSHDKYDSEIKFLRQKVNAMELKFSDIYVRGKELYNQILNDKKIGRWSKEDYQNFIDYFQSLDFPFVFSFETDFVRLSDRQKIFLILCHIGKTKEQVMQIMTIEDGSFRSIKSRIEGQKR